MEGGCGGRDCVNLELYELVSKIVYIDEEDIESLNALALSQWEDIVAVCLFKPFQSNFAEFPYLAMG